MGENEMIQAILEGDERAFKLLVDNYQLMVVNTCYAFVHQEDDARDIAQDVFVQVYESLGAFKFKSKLSTWIYRIAVNKSINFCRSSRGRTRVVNIEKWNMQQELSSDDLLPQEELEREEERSLLHRAIDTLPEKQRAALLLHRYEDLSYKEIAEVMGISLASVESLLFRAKQNLEKQIING